MLRLELFGAFSLLQEGVQIQLPTRKAEALLTYLALARPSVHTRDKLANLLWGDSTQGRQNLRQTLFAIRKATDGNLSITSDGDRISLDANSFESDVAEFDELSTAQSRDSLHCAADLYRSELLDSFKAGEENFDSWLDGQREHYRDRAIKVGARLLEPQASAEELERALQFSLRLLSMDPARESLHRLVMQAYIRQQRRDAAIRQYYSCVDILRRRMNVEPEQKTKALFKSILAQEVAAGAEPEIVELQSISILVVEDNHLSSNLLQAMLEAQRFKLTCVDDGAKALIEIGRQRFDLVLLDLNLPTIDGFTLLDIIQKNGFKVPVIIMTDHLEVGKEVRALDQGAADFIRKPLQKDVLIKRIEKVLRQVEVSSL